ncbi:hypothetical protein MKW98_030344 [Papaver atlanticum]|uniref:HORMA domain-containing protein n=1 Tax=Papaver atlanticum TaxID=357466 RepID=A0AAD4TJA1_9MAGN|nr:hypothetical protein MKW98_030344 [Papaver atlanticum]
MVCSRLFSVTISFNSSLLRIPAFGTTKPSFQIYIFISLFRETKIPKLMPIDAESRRIIDGMESGVYDALQKKYLRTLLFCISEAIGGPIIEEYAFSFSYSNSNIKDVMMNISRTRNKKQGATFRSNGILPQFFRGCSEE